MRILLLITFLTLQAHAQRPSLVGLWKQNCQIINNDDVIDMQIQIEPHELAFQGYGYEENNCKTQYIFYEELYTIQNILLQANSTSDYEVDLITKEISYTPLSDEVARALNEGSFCGLHDWKDHVKTVVTGQNCNDENLRRKDQVYYQSLRLAEDSPDFFYWGLTTHTLDGSSAAQRPKAFEALPFKKQP